MVWCVEIADFLVRVDIHIFPVCQVCTSFPQGRDSLVIVTAKDRIDNDPPADRRAAGFLIIHRALIERFIAGNENDLELIVVRTPLQVCNSRFDDVTAIFISTIGGQCEQFLGDPVEVGREWRDHTQMPFAGRN